jgi:hypothetical protein
VNIRGNERGDRTKCRREKGRNGKDKEGSYDVKSKELDGPTKVMGVVWGGGCK